jgi:hypothetical protein
VKTLGHFSGNKYVLFQAAANGNVHVILYGISTQIQVRRMPPELYKFLEENGYNPYSMPDRDFVPLTIVRKNDRGKYTREGSLEDFVEFPSGSPSPEKPPCLPPEEKPEFSMMSSEQIDASLGINLLKNIFAHMDLSSFSTNITFNKVNKMELSYNNVVSDSVDPVKIAKYISPPATPSSVSDQLEVNRTFIIYDILRSNSFQIKCYAKEMADAKTEIIVIKNALQDQSKITITQESDNSLSFKGSGYLTFALRIRPFWVSENNTFFFKAPRPSILGRFMMVRREQPIRDSVLLPRGAFYSFDS